MRLLVTGASGLLGLNLSLTAQARGYAVTGLLHSRRLQGVPFDTLRADLLDQSAALAEIEAARPEALIHCAALASLNAAEAAPDLAARLNGEVPGFMAEAANRWGVPFIHVSTDAVFDGRTGGYDESDPPNPLSVYARTKLAGEQAVLSANPKAAVARVVFYGWSLSGRRSLSEFFFNNLLTGTPIKGFSDTYFCPLYVEDLAVLLLEMLEKRLSGMYHVVSSEHLSKYDFGVRIAKRFGFDPGLITPVSMADLARGAPRALRLVLETDKLEDALGHSLPGIAAGLDKLHQRWETGYPEQIQAYAAGQ
jgi:dTDP-4-dehydrorhamnose reductase